MTDRVISLYRNMLTSLGFKISTNDVIKIAMNGEEVQLVSDGKPIVLPTYNNLKSPSNKLFFHPLREDIAGGEPKVLETLRKAMSVRFNIIFSSLAIDILSLLASPTLRNKIKSEQSDMAIAIGEVEETVVKKITQLTVAMAKKDPHKSFISMYNRRGAMVDGKTYKRACFVSFPLYTELLKDEDKVFGVKVTNTQKETFLKLLRFMFPGIEDDDMYSTGSNSKIAPFFDAFMKTVVKLQDTINNILEIYGNILNTSPEYKADISSWYSEFENMDNLHKDIMLIPTSDTVKEETGEQPVIQQQNQIPTPQPQQQRPIPVQHTQPAQHRSSLSELLSRNPQTAAMAYAPPPMMMNMNTNIRQPPSWATPGTPMSPASGVVDPWGRPVPVSPIGAGPVPNINNTVPW